MNPGFAAYLAKRKSQPAPQAGYQAPAEPKSISSAKTKPGTMSGGRKYPAVSMSPAMMSSIKAAPKGKIPAGLAKYLAAHKKGASK